ncbi:HAMP domain-containing protein [Reinekea forsetii]|nr:HAMP domain-containing protein [Reinekea forsetii]
MLKFGSSSLYSRFLVLLLAGLMTAFFASNYLWIHVLELKKADEGRDMAVDMAASVGRTVEFIRAYPKEYRHIILNQMRDIGGSRFLVSINEEFINVKPIAETSISTQFLTDFNDSITSTLGQRLREMQVTFADPTTLSVYKNDIKLIDLPPRWAQNSLIREPDVAPVLVAQMPLGGGEWLYLAGLLPDPYYLSDVRGLSNEQLSFLVITLLVLVVISWLLVKWLTAPLTNLSKAARHLGTDIEYDLKPLMLKGSKEVRQTASAFNFMQERIIRFIENRERMFSAISHDLKTPITRLRLRAELMEESDIQEKMIRDLDELEALVKGALDLGKSTDLHEATHPIDVNQLLNTLKEECKLMGSEIEVKGLAKRTFFGKPLALKRCLSNLIHNGIFYGSKVRVDVVDSRHELKIYIVDNGPGIPEDHLEKVFEPYVRLEASRNRNTGGAGLGLSIARNIAHGLGGQLRLRNRIGFGLEAAVILPRI